ncbi:MAG: saccharopine dehydrogenase NADP-binding domain-containing protein [Symbiobacteriia bacterium]
MEPGILAFMVHPLDASYYAKKFPGAQYLPDAALEGIGRLLPPVNVAPIRNIESPYNRASGWFVGCTLTSRQMLSLPEPLVLRKIIQTGKLAERLGAKILGLGAFTKVVGDAGITVARNLRIPVTTGNSYTVATGLEETRRAAEVMGHDFSTCEVVVVGATGSIGAVTAQILAREAKNLTLVSRDERKLDRLARTITAQTGLVPRITTNLRQALSRADVVLSSSSSVDAIIHPEDLKAGAVVCDLARPRDVASQVVEVRDDVLVLDGGVVQVPGDQVDLGFNFGFPPGTVMACMAETMILSLENRYESFTLGRELTVSQVDEISGLAVKHGFRTTGFRSFERELSQAEVEQVKANAQRRRQAEGTRSSAIRLTSPVAASD